MADVSAYVEDIMTSPLLVRRKIRTASRYALDDQEILQAIIDATSEIKDSLTPWPYSGDSQLKPSSPFASPILKPFNTEQTGLRDAPYQPNHGKGKLRAVQVQSTAITDDFVVEFTSATAFTVTALLLGAEGSGTTAANLTLTSGNVIIPSTFWNGTHKEGDHFLFSTFTYYPGLVRLCSEIAAGNLMRELFGSEAPRVPGSGRDFLDSAMEKLEQYQDPDGPKGKKLPSLTALNTDPIEHGGLAISDYGVDTADYEPFESIPEGVVVN